jgi:plastocyanin
VNRRLAHLARLVAIPSLLVLGTMSAPTVAAGDPCFHGYVMPPATTGSGTDIKLMPCSFEPTVTTVAVGTEVTFFNGPEYTHLITGANQAWGSRDVEIQPDSTVSYTFDEPGIYPYACALHVGMAGAIVVGDPDEALAAGSTDGSQTGSATGTTGQAATNATEPAPAGPVTEPASATSNWLPLVAAGIGAGLVAGAAAVWLAVRRRAPGERPLVHAD